MGWVVGTTSEDRMILVAYREILRSLSTPSRLARYASRWSRKSRLSLVGFDFVLISEDEGSDGWGSMAMEATANIEIDALAVDDVFRCKQDSGMTS